MGGITMMLMSQKLCDALSKCFACDLSRGKYPFVSLQKHDDKFMIVSTDGYMLVSSEIEPYLDNGELFNNTVQIDYKSALSIYKLCRKHQRVSCKIVFDKESSYAEALGHRVGIFLTEYMLPSWRRLIPSNKGELPYIAVNWQHLSRRFHALYSMDILAVRCEYVEDKQMLRMYGESVDGSAEIYYHCVANKPFKFMVNSQMMYKLIQRVKPYVVYIGERETDPLYFEHETGVALLMKMKWATE
jgi:hypothetical protein